MPHAFEIAAELHLVLHGAIRQQHQDDGKQKQHSDDTGVARPPGDRERQATDETVDDQPERGDGEKDGAVTARERLRREERDGEPEVARPPGIEIRVQIRQAERNPLHHRQVRLPEPEETRRREREDESGEKRGRGAEPEPPRQQIGPEPAQHHGEQRDQVHREHRVAGQPRARGAP